MDLDISKSEPALQSSVRSSYTIAFSMRSGSNELCNLLQRNGLGSPGELFRVFEPDPGASAAQALASVDALVEAHTRNGIFGSKMSHDHRAKLEEVLLRADPRVYTVGNYLPRHHWLWLRRRDKIDQAISLSMSEKTQSWTSLDRPQAIGEHDFDFFHVMSRMMMLYMNDAAWTIYFETYGINPYIIEYESLFENLAENFPPLVSSILDGPATQDLDLTQTLSVQRNAVSQQWRERFVRHMREIGTTKFVQDIGTDLQRWSAFFQNAGWRDNASNVSR